MSMTRFSRRSLRIASLCAVAALCGLPPLAFAQKQASSFQASARPFYEEDLTRKALGDIPKLNDQDTADARMTPGSKGHMVIMGAKTEVWCPENSFIELAPKIDIVGFTPIGIMIWEDNNKTQSHPIENIPLLRIDPPVGGVNRKVVRVVAFDAQNKMKTLMECKIHARVTHQTVAAMDYKEEKERCGFKIRDRQLFTNTCLYLGDMYLGRVEENAGQVEVDERRLPPGKYSCQMVGKNEDDMLVPGASSEFTVKPRYDIACDGSEKQIVINQFDEKLKVTVAHTPGLSIKKTRVSIAGCKAVEKTGDSFTVELPMEAVPDGKCYIEVIGVAEDGVTYPVESLPVNIKNIPWEQKLAHTQEYEHAEANQAKINELWQDVCANLKQADFEPYIYQDSKTFTLEKIVHHFKVGRKGDFQAAATKAFIQMSQLQLQSARLYRTLGMRSKASDIFYRVWKELGTEDSNGDAAKRELDSMKKEAASL